jgi:membrane peptidoglycan carboxypeptidase
MTDTLPPDRRPGSNPDAPAHGYAPAPAPAPDPAPGKAAPRWPGWPSKSAALPRPRRTGARRLLPSWRMVLAGGLVTASAASAALLAGYFLVDIPAPKAAATAENNVYLYADGSQLARVGEVNRETVPLSQVPGPVRRAVLAAEDRDFFDSASVDAAAMVRAAWNMLRGEGRQSGSTITQQYVKNYYLDQEQTLTRKVKELFISIKLGSEVSKEEILAGYLNTSYFGRNAYGIQAAAQAYYGKDAAALSTAEGAYLAALLNAPSVYDVSAAAGNRGAAVARWEYVLDGMVSEGWLSQSRRDAMRFPEPLPVTPTADLSGQRGYLVEATMDYLLRTGTVDEERLAEGGLKITTTFDPDRQRALAEAVDGRLLSALSPGERAQDAYVRAGATSVEAATGRVVAMYGGRDYTKEYVNNATRRDYQAASTFKPFVYAAALEHRARTRDGARISPETKYDGDSGRPVVDSDGRRVGWSPENEGEKDYGELTVAEAMDKSVNAVFAQLGQDVGARRVKETAVALGVPEDTPGLASAQGSIALGTATPSTLDLAQAYATLAAHGVRHPAVLVEKVTLDGRELSLPRAAPERAVSRRAADGTTAMLRGVVENGTGMAARSAGRPAAGKTGTAEEDRAAWFAGYTPELSTVIAVFGQDPASGAQRALYGAGGLERVSGGGFPARIWGQYTAAALAGEPAAEFELPHAREQDVPPETTPTASVAPPPSAPSTPSTPSESASASATLPPPTWETPQEPGPVESGPSPPGPSPSGPSPSGPSPSEPSPSEPSPSEPYAPPAPAPAPLSEPTAP